MSGNTPNSNILGAIDEVIKALNDLATEVNAPDLSGVEQAINDLTLTCSPTINVSSSAPSVVVYCSCGGGGSTTSDPPFIPPDIEPTEGGTPPNGYSEPTEIDNRKCKAANYLYDGTLEVLDKFAVLNIETFLAVSIAILSGAIVTLLSGVISGVGAFILGVYGGIEGIVAVLTYQNVSISSLKTVWEDKHSDIICSLYNATSANPAIDEIAEILEVAGLGSANIALFKAIFTVEVATILFFKPAMKGVTIEQDLDGYTATVDCANCGGCGMYIELGTDKAVDGDSASAAAQAVYSSYYGFDIYYMRVYLSSTSGEACGENRTSSVNITSGTLTVVNATYDKFYTYFDDVGLTLSHQFDTPDTTNDYAVIQIQSRTAFSATVTRT